jgi:hypothetical protein
VFTALRRPALESREEPLMVADAGPPADHEYGYVGRDAIWLDWLGRQRETHPGHRALQRAQYGDPFEIRPDGSIVDAVGQKVAVLSKAGREAWLPQVGRQLKLRLIAVVLELADAPSRPREHAEKLEVDKWFTAVWEARWRA